MKTYVSNHTSLPTNSSLTRTGLCLAVAVLALAALPVCAGHHTEPNDDYQQLNLVSDLAGVAMVQDTNLVNAWGMSFSGTSPFWISDNGKGVSTLYSVTYTNGTVVVKTLGLVVTIPGTGKVTGQLFNGTHAFHTNMFIFCSEDGIVSGWRGSLGTKAEVLVHRTNAVYTGMTLTSSNGQPILLTANFSEGTLDAYGTNLTLLAQFADPTAPADYAPYNVQSLNGMVFVAFARQDNSKQSAEPGRGRGLIDVFDPTTGVFTRFATGSAAHSKHPRGRHDHEKPLKFTADLDAPWGLALSPTNFGAHADQLLVANHGNGTIAAFEANGKSQGLLEGSNERHLVIDGLWGLAFGNVGSAGRPQTLYFTAGPMGGTHGLLGSLDVVSEPEPVTHPGHGRGMQ